MNEDDTRAVVTIDAMYHGPERAAAYLLVEGARAAFVDNNTAHAVPLLLDALDGRGISRDAVEYLIVTHVHLDHAGGTSALAEACPRATIVAHPRGVPHLADPARLTASARRVYGDDAFDALYGRIDPIPRERLRPVDDGERLMLGGRALTLLHTPGHAKHHVCIHDEGTNTVFTGDAFGVAHPALQGGRRPFFLFSCPPTDFDAGQARASIERIVATGAARACVTHYGGHERVGDAGEELRWSVAALESILNDARRRALAGEALFEYCLEEVRRAFLTQLERCGLDTGPANWERIEADWVMNARGLAYYAAKTP